MKNLTTNTKSVAAGAMEATIYEQGEALIRVRSARVALEPGELKVLSAFLSAHHNEQKAKEQQRKQETHG